MDAGNTPDIKIFATMLHAHLAGRGVRVRHIRDGVELPPLAEDHTYDFDFQEFRAPPGGETVVKPVSTTEYSWRPQTDRSVRPTRSSMQIQGASGDEFLTSTK